MNTDKAPNQPAIPPLPPAVVSPKRPVDVIRQMNPGKWIPTGAELAAMLKRRTNTQAKARREHKD